MSEIARHLDISEAQVRTALDELAEQRLLRRSPDRLDKVRAVHPTVGLTTLLAQAEAEILERRQQLEATRAWISTIAAEQDAIRAPSQITWWEGVDAVRWRLAELSRSATSECLSLNPNSTQTVEAKHASRDLNEGMLRRGVTVRCVYQDSFRDHPHVLGYARWLAGLGGQLRTVPTVPLLMVSYDRRTVLLPADPRETAAGAVEITSPGVVAAVCALFDQMWTTATVFGEDIAATEPILTRTEQTILSLLAEGHTDEVLARRLGVSLSTVRRTMAQLMERLNARSRFQAGVQATRRGWVSG
ncbi:MAG TPA: helix-turn-helix transcriptional regulator [Catenuloplanes sp.]